MLWKDIIHIQFLTAQNSFFNAELQYIWVKVRKQNMWVRIRVRVSIGHGKRGSVRVGKRKVRVWKQTMGRMKG